MKLGGLLTAVGVLAILGGTLWWTNKHPTVDAKSKTPDAPKILSLDPKQITDIRIAKTGSDPIELAKLATTWEITKPEMLHADQDAVDMLANSIATLTADRLIDDHPSDLNAFGLTTPATEVDVTLKDGKTSKVLIGSDTPAATGTYVKLESDPKVYTIPTSTKGNFDRSTSDLRDKRLLTFNQDKLTSVTLAGKGPAIEFGKNATGDWQITKPKPMRADTLLVDDLVRKLKDARMDVASTDAKEQFAKAEKVGTASTTDNSGTQTIELHKAKDNSYYAKSSVGIYKTAGDLGDSFTRGVDDYRNKKLFDFGFNDPTKVEINGVAYQKSGDKWMSGATQYDSGSLQSMIDKLRDLSATKFSEKMAGTQAFTFGITSGDKNRYEKVTIDKDGDAYDAQRDGDPTVYVIDSKTIDDLQKAAAGVKPFQAPRPEKKK
jgi:DNA-binding beta-propeller fold protein YncE